MTDQLTSTLNYLCGGSVKRRYQRMEVKRRKDQGRACWYCRYFEDVAQLDGTIKPIQRRHFLGWAEGDDKVKIEDAERERDKIRARLNTPAFVTGAAILFGRIAELWRQNHVCASAGKIAEPTRRKYIQHLDSRILPQWKDYRLGEITTLAVEKWLREIVRAPRKTKPGETERAPEPLSWNTRADIRNVMSSIFTKAKNWGYYDLRNPIETVDLGRKRDVYDKRFSTRIRPHSCLAISTTSSV